MTFNYEARIARAKELAEIHLTAASLLSFYRDLAEFQKPIFEQAGSEVQSLVRHFPSLLELVRANGPEPLARFGSEHLRDAEAQAQLLLACWQGDAPHDEGRFYARVLLQPYAERLANGAALGSMTGSESTCPFCSARPALAVLRGEGDGAKRSLQCSICSSEWLYRRVLCPGCGEENKDHLPIYIAEDFDYVRVDACDTCRTYIKSIDLTKNGHAVPIVDEIATVALNIWADEHDYAKLEPNLLGM